jgi:hypothetical protein
VSQQKESTEQMFDTHESQFGSSKSPAVQGSWAQLPPGQAPQSCGQVMHVSVGAEQLRSPQAGGQAPQSCGHVLQVSVGAVQVRSPQTGAQAPQSCWQLMHVSPGSQLWLPHCAPPLLLLLELEKPLLVDDVLELLPSLPLVLELVLEVELVL